MMLFFSTFMKRNAFWEYSKLNVEAEKCQDQFGDRTKANNLEIIKSHTEKDEFKNELRSPNNIIEPD